MSRVHRLAVTIPPKSARGAPRWGDYHLAHGLVDALAEHSFQGSVVLRPDWDGPLAAAADVLIHLRGRVPRTPRSDALEVVWLMSHPDDVPAPELEGFDLVLVASEAYARRLEVSVDVPVRTFLHAAADPFRTGAKDDSLATELLFVGNTTGRSRPPIHWAIERDLPITVYGKGWKKVIPESNWAGGYFPYERLPDLYASASIVLNHHWPDMADHGFVSNRIFDALAAGAFVLSDPVSGLEDLFGDAVPTYTSADDLADHCRRYLADPDERSRHMGAARDAVLSEHTISARAAVLSGWLTALLDSR